MAKTGINFERCNVCVAMKHNLREKSYIDAVNASPNKHYSIFGDRTCTNLSWINPEYEGVTLEQIVDEYRGIYRDMFHQSPQEQDKVKTVKDKKTGMMKTVTQHGWAPIREGVCPVKEDTKIADLRQFADYLETKGLKVISISIHRDEGHTDPLTGDRKYNYHAHIIVDWFNTHTAKTVKLGKLDAVEFQTRIAECLGMERGASKEITGADHLSANEYRAKAATQEIRDLEALASAERDKLVGLQKEVTDFTRRATDAQTLALSREKAATEARKELDSINSQVEAKRAEIDLINDEIGILRWLRELRDILLGHLKTVLNHDGHSVQHITAAQRYRLKSGKECEEITVQNPGKPEYKMLVEDSGETFINHDFKTVRTSDSPLTAAFCRQLSAAHHEILASALPTSVVRVPEFAKDLANRAPRKAIEELQARDLGQGQGQKMKP